MILKHSEMEISLFEIYFLTTFLFIPSPHIHFIAGEGVRIIYKDTKISALLKRGLSTMKRFNVAGWPNCSAYTQARTALQGLQAIFKEKIAVTVHECEYMCHFLSILWSTH